VTAGEQTRVGLLRVISREGGLEPAKLVADLVAEQLDHAGCAVLRDSILRPTLRQHRIRTMAGIDAESSRLLADETGITHVLIVTIESWSEDVVPEVALTARVLVPGWSVVASAASASATGLDYEEMFGSGRIETVDNLAVVLVEELIAQLSFPVAPPAGFEPIAVIPLDVTADAPTGAEAAGDWLVAVLAAEGVRVVEPGDVRLALLTGGRAPRGDIDLRGAEILADKLWVGWILAGSLDRWSRISGDARRNVPSLTWGLRLLDTDSQRIIAVLEHDRDGHDGEGVFRAGRKLSLGDLAIDTARRVAREINKAQRIQLARKALP